MQDQDHRRLLLAGPSRGLRLAVLAAASLALMVADHRQQYLGVVRDWLSIAVYPVHWAVDAPSSAWRFASEALTTQRSLEEEKAQLRAENRELKLRLLRFDALEQENLRLREARAGSARVAERSLVAEILRVDLDPFRQRVLVNKGSREDVFVGQAALDATGVFGQVTRIGPISAEIIMISDPDHAMPVQVNRTGVRTIAVGQGQTGSLLLPYLPGNADIEEGDLVVTSGLGGVFPPGYPVAKVSAVRRDPAEPLLTVTATPTARLDRDPEVLLVWFDNRIVEPVEETTDAAATQSPVDQSARPGDPAPAASVPGAGAAPAPVAGD